MDGTSQLWACPVYGDDNQSEEVDSSSEFSGFVASSTSIDSDDNSSSSSSVSHIFNSFVKPSAVAER